MITRISTEDTGKMVKSVLRMDKAKEDIDLKGK